MKQLLHMKKTITSIGVIAWLLLPFVSSAQIRVACVGDSTTWGYGLTNQSVQCYPARLQAELGSGYAVKNFGVNGACMAKNDPASYWNTSTFTNAQNYDAQIIIILLGTNDGDPPRWNNVKNEFYDDYVAMVNVFRANGKNPLIYAGYPLPCFTSAKAAQDTNIKTQVIPLIQQVATSQGLSSLDFSTTMQNSNWFQADGIHPNATGAQRMADLAFNALIPGSGPVVNGTYKIINRNSGLAVDVKGLNTTNGSPVQQYGYNGGANQRWTVTSLGGSTYKIIGVQSGLALDVVGSGTANGTGIDIWPYSGGANQQWSLTATSGGNYRLTPSNATGSALDVQHSGTTNSIPLQIWNYNGGNSQQWSFQAP
jgi:lysophospholipase L1-like esterase